MSKLQRIPRPRHLFPELAAFLIESKRTNLRAKRTLQQAIGHVPIWITGSLAGVAGIMLAISLFFVHEPQLQAAATRIDPVYVPMAVVPVTPQAPQVNLQARLFRTTLPGTWDEERVVTKNSSAPPINAITANLMDDRWKKTQIHSDSGDSFVSYLIRAAGLPSSWLPLLASDVVPTPQTFVSTLNMGIVVEKSGDLQGSPQEPVTYQILVRNTSLFAIENLTIRERVTDLVRITDVNPVAGISGDELVWNVDQLLPGGTRTFQVTLVPETDGEIQTMTRIVPTTRISTSVLVKAASAPELEVMPFEPAEEPKPKVEPIPEPVIQTPVGAPELKLTYTEVKPLKKGDNLSMIFAVTNVGTAAAEDVILFVRLSGEFEHRYGEFVKHQVGTLKPGESRRALLQATARDTGDAHLDASLTMQGTETEARELKIPIRTETPPAGNDKKQPLVQKPVVDQNARWIAAEHN